MTNLLSKSVEERAINLILKGIDPIEAVKQALLDEMNLIGSLFEGGSELNQRGKIAKDEIMDRYLKKSKVK